MHCPGCGTPVAPGTQNCPRCGHLFPSVNFTEITDRLHPLATPKKQENLSYQPFFQTQNTGSFRSLRSFSNTASLPAQSAPLPASTITQQEFSSPKIPVEQTPIASEPIPQRPLPPPPEEFSPSQHTASQHVIRPDLIIERSNTPRPEGHMPRLTRPLKMSATIGKPRHRFRRLLLAFVLLLICLGLIGSGIYFYPTIKKTFTNNHQNAILGPLSQTPSGHIIDQVAAANLSHFQVTNTIDHNYQPVGSQPQFQAHQTVYFTFSITAHEAGFIQARWYLDNNLFASDKIKHEQKNNTGYFGLIFNQAGTGAVELYWCGREDCTDALLASAYGFAVDES